MGVDTLSSLIKEIVNIPRNEQRGGGLRNLIVGDTLYFIIYVALAFPVYLEYGVCLVGGDGRSLLIDSQTSI